MSVRKLPMTGWAYSDRRRSCSGETAVRRGRGEDGKRLDRYDEKQARKRAPPTHKEGIAVLAYRRKYWQVLAPLIKRSMKRDYGSDFVDETLKKAKTVYRQMLREVDDVGADNPMASNIYESFVFLAVWKAAEGKLGAEELRKITRDVLSIPLLRAMSLYANANTAKGMRRIGRMMHADQAWLDAHPQYKAASWDFHFDETLHRDGFYYHFTQCPLNNYARQHDMLDILPVMCDVDYMTAALMRAKLHREQTLASGGEICDYWFYGDKLKDPK